MTEVKEKVQKVTNENKTTSNEEEIQTVIPVPLKKPIEIDGQKIDSIKLDFSDFTADDILQIDEQLRREGKFFDNVYNQHVLIKIISRVANIKVEDLRKLHGADYLEVTFTARNFFIQW